MSDLVWRARKMVAIGDLGFLASDLMEELADALEAERARITKHTETCKGMAADLDAYRALRARISLVQGDIYRATTDTFGGGTVDYNGGMQFVSEGEGYVANVCLDYRDDSDDIGSVDLPDPIMASPEELRAYGDTFYAASEWLEAHRRALSSQ